MARWWTRKRIALVATVAVLVLAAGAYGVFALVSSGGEPPVSISDAGASGGGQASASAAPFDGDFDGTWTVVHGDSFVGYRVREQLVFLPAPNDAVGRTTAVEGSLSIDGLEVTQASVTADLTQLQSDEDRRDQAIRDFGLQTSAFPSATFELTEPVALAERPTEDEVVEVEATGELTLHGVTREVTFPLQAKWRGGRLVVVGSLEIDFADYEISPPSLGPASVQDHGTIELELFFTKG